MGLGGREGVRRGGEGVVEWGGRGGVGSGACGKGGREGVPKCVEFEKPEQLRGEKVNYDTETRLSRRKRGMWMNAESIL
jgi:hypothetical protein